MRVLVVGATGYLGSHMVAELKRNGYWVRALTRRKDAFAGVDQPPDDVFVGEATKPDTLTGICDDIDIVFSALGQTNQKGRLDYWDVDYAANKAMLDLAVASEVKQFLFISVVRPDLTIDLDIVAAREALVRDMAVMPIAHTVVRATGFFSDMGEFLTMAKAGRVWLIGQGTARINPVHGTDVAAAAISAFGATLTEIEVGGPDELTYQEIGTLAFDTLGQKRRLTRVPVWIVNIALTALRLVNRRQYTGFAFLSRMMQNDILGPRTGKRHLRDDFQERAK